jgi:hypothetical protein
MDPFLATYVSESSFTTVGEWDHEFTPGRAVQCSQGVDGTVESSVVESSYSIDTGLTTVVVQSIEITENLVSVKRGACSTASTPIHDHITSGGPIPTAALSQEQVDELLAQRELDITAGETLAAFDVVYADLADSGKCKKAVANGTTTQRDARYIVGDAGIEDDATGPARWPGQFITNEAWTWTPEAWLYLSDTAGQLSETPGTNEVRVAFSVTATMIFMVFPGTALSQDLASGASPTFAGLTLSGLTGIMQAKGATAVGVLTSSTALTILRRKSDNSDYAFELVNLSDLADMNFSSLAAGDIIYRDGSSPAKWVLLHKATDGNILSLASGLPAWLDAKLKHLSDVAAAVTDSSVDGDILVRISGAWNRLPKPSDASYFLGADGSTKEPKWKAAPGAAGGETNTMSSLDNGGGTAGVDLYDSKDGVDLRTKSLDGGQFEPSGDHEVKAKLSIIVGAAPDYTPPAFEYNDVDKIIIPAGHYYKAGHRIRGQYQNPTGDFWTVVSALTVDVDGTYNAGVVSGMIGGAEVASSWYSVWMLGNTADDFLVLPFLRVKTIDYNVSHAGKTTINPAAHADGTTAANGFITANDAWNDYRLVNITYDAYDGNVYTIEDTVNATPDEVVINGDITAQKAATGWLMLIPPAGVDCLYLGCIFIDGSSNVRSFRRDDWKTQWSAVSYITGTKNTTPAVTNVCAAVPPTARYLYATVHCSAEASTGNQVDVVLYSGTSGTNVIKTIQFGLVGGTITYIRNQGDISPFQFTAVTGILNKFVYWNGASEIAANTGAFAVSGWVE